MSRKSARGTSHDRRKNDRQAREDSATKTVYKPMMATANKDAKEEATQRRNELWTFLGIALGCASWGWTVLAPDSSMIFGSLLLVAAVLSVLLGVWRIWKYRKVWLWVTSVVVLIGFVVFDWAIVVQPQRGKPFRNLLVEGYHLTNECEAIPADTEMPTWMRDQSKEWQARTQQLIADKLSSADAQTWQKAIVIGTVEHEAMNGYQCLWLSNKVAALESIIARDFDSSVKHDANVGAIYWVNAVDGSVDISDLLKDGKRTGRMYVNGGGTGQVRITGYAPELKNGTISFGLIAP